MSFHINPKTGNPGNCLASAGKCPFGTDEEHFTSREAARASYEGKMSEDKVSSNEQKIVSANARHRAAQEAFLKAERAMNDTANWEGVSILTAEGQTRARAVENYKRCSERVTKTKAALDKLNFGKLSETELYAKVAIAQDALDAFYDRNRYPSKNDKQLIALNDQLLQPKDLLHRKKFHIPNTWKTQGLSDNGVLMIPATKRTGPNGSTLMATTYKPSSAPVRAPYESLYVVTSAGIYISGPYDSPYELEIGVASYKGSTDPGPIGRD